VIIRMGKARYAWITLLPMAWLATVTMTASYLKIFSSDPRLGFLTHAGLYESTLAAGQIPKGVASAAAGSRAIFNDRFDAVVTAFFALSVIIIIADSARVWYGVVVARKPAMSTEIPFEPRVAVAGD
jgi:carbon starvation protein